MPLSLDRSLDSSLEGSPQNPTEIQNHVSLLSYKFDYDVLLIDDNLETRELMRVAFSREGINVRTLASVSELATEEQQRHELVIFGIWKNPERAPISALVRDIQEIIPQTAICVFCHESDIESLKRRAAAESVGVLSWPIDHERFFKEINSTLKRREQRIKLENTLAELRFIGKSPAIRKVFRLIEKVANSDVNVLITGESGTGKEIVAHAIHKCSPRAQGPFMAINCAAIPADLLESELFGHAKGSFTGAVDERKGLFEECNGGTVLLDEIGDLPLSLQSKILRVLQLREIKPVGHNQSRKVDVRVLAATHKNLEMLTRKGEFREDLHYRLNVVPIRLPPLRERVEDIPLLAEHFLSAHSLMQHGPKALNEEALQVLKELHWAGNIRELENVITRSAVLSDCESITAADIQANTHSGLARDASPMAHGEVRFETAMVSDEAELKTLSEIEREYIQHVLIKTGYKKELAARILGVDRKTLYNKEKLYGFRPLPDKHLLENELEKLI